MTYIDAFLLPVPTAAKEVYAAKAARIADAFREHGALQVVECWGEDRPDFATAAEATSGENAVLSWIIWPSKDVRDAGHAMIQNDERLELDDPLFNPSRMRWSGFECMLNTAKQEQVHA